jgi:hypothetical protein
MLDGWLHYLTPRCGVSMAFSTFDLVTKQYFDGWIVYYQLGGKLFELR